MESGQPKCYCYVKIIIKKSTFGEVFIYLFLFSIFIFIFFYFLNLTVIVRLKTILGLLNLFELPLNANRNDFLTRLPKFNSKITNDARNIY